MIGDDVAAAVHKALAVALRQRAMIFRINADRQCMVVAEGERRVRVIPHRAEALWESAEAWAEIAKIVADLAAFEERRGNATWLQQDRHDDRGRPMFRDEQFLVTTQGVRLGWVAGSIERPIFAAWARSARYVDDIVPVSEHATIDEAKAAVERQVFGDALGSPLRAGDGARWP